MIQQYWHHWTLIVNSEVKGTRSSENYLEADTWEWSPLVVTLCSNNLCWECSPLRCHVTMITGHSTMCCSGLTHTLHYCSDLMIVLTPDIVTPTQWSPLTTDQYQCSHLAQLHLIMHTTGQVCDQWSSLSQVLSHDQYLTLWSLVTCFITKHCNGEKPTNFFDD